VTASVAQSEPVHTPYDKEMKMARNEQRNDKQDITTVLSREHRVVAAILSTIEEACEAEEFEEIAEPFAILKTKLTAHARGEERSVYPRFAELNDEIKDLIGEANEEHALVHDKLAELEGLDVSDEEWKAKFTVLKELVEHHVKDEEGEIFPKVRKAMKTADAEALAQEYLAEKLEVGGEEAEEITPFELEVMTKEELLERARELSLDGTSSMTKDELVEALSRPS
jgi:hemerythrin superfamily protein